jgi:glycerate kinase
MAGVIEKDKITRILATDCGSTTTKAILIEKRGTEFRLSTRGEAPTTVEAPFEDVTRGVLNSVMEVEELSGVKLLDGETIIKPKRGARGAGCRRNRDGRHRVERRPPPARED